MSGPPLRLAVVSRVREELYEVRHLYSSTFVTLNRPSTYSPPYLCSFRKGFLTVERGFLIFVGV